MRSEARNTSNGGRRTIIFVGHARLPENVAAYQVFRVLTLELEVDPETEVIVDASCNMVPSLGEKFIGGSAIGRDVGERKRMDEALHESKRRLEQALAELQAAQQQIIQQERLRALGEMASGIAHDFNNALAPILGFSELLLMRPDDLNDKAKVTSYLELIHIGARDAAVVVSRLREFYRPRTADEPFFPVDLNDWSGKWSTSPSRSGRTRR